VCDLTVEHVKDLLAYMSDEERLLVLEYLYKQSPQMYDKATMPESLRRFYDSKSVRPEGPLTKHNPVC